MAGDIRREGIGGQGRSHRAGGARLMIAAGHNDDDIGAVDCGRGVGRHPLDRRKTGLLALDIDPATGPDVGETTVIEVMEPQPAPEHPQLGRQIDPADPGADDRYGRVRHPGPSKSNPFRLKRFNLPEWL